MFGKFNFKFQNEQQLTYFMELIKGKAFFKELVNEYEMYLKKQSKEKETKIFKDKHYIIDLSGNVEGECYGNRCRTLTDFETAPDFSDALKKVAQKFPNNNFRGELWDSDGDWYEVNINFSYNNNLLSVNYKGYNDCCYDADHIVKKFISEQKEFSIKDFYSSNLTQEQENFVLECIEKNGFKLVEKTSYGNYNVEQFKKV